MFNLERAKKQFVSSFQPTITVKMIHDDFDTAVDELINKALNIDEAKKDKYERLRRLGFSQTEEMNDIAPQIKEESKQKEVSGYVNKYRINYPGYKFITQEMVESICKKYGLAKASVGYYKGSIPDKNLAEIEAFKLLKEDEKDGRYTMSYDDTRLQICAPIKDFDTKYLKLEGTNLVPKDPIVLQPIIGGYMILSKWGAEANDQDLVNEIDN